ncbi:hemolysin family protein [Patescibacteria group bacterium]|nr:hemolysin family protein [Patescibacteria group bacterium]
MDPTGLVLVIILLFLSGFFSASETSIVSLSPAKVRTLIDKKARGSFFLNKLKANPHKTLITILVGNNVVNIAASALTTVLVTRVFDSAAVGIATGVLTLLILIFGEILPKSFATAKAQQIGLFVSPILYVLGIVLTPIIWILDLIVAIFFKILGHKKTARVTDEELIAMAAISAEEGIIGTHEKELIENVLEFTDIRVEEIMTPRVHIDAIPEDYNLNEASDFFIHKTHTRIPVYRETIDHIVGILTLKDLFESLYECEEEDKMTVRQIDLNTPLRVSHSMQIHDLFLLFKKQRQHLAIVIDEYGGTAGLITMEDLLEEIVGEIEDESDLTEERLKKITELEYEVSGHIQLDELEEILNIEFKYPGHRTISYLIIEELDRLPKKGDKITVKDWEFTVTQMWRHSILKVHVKKEK